MRLHFVHRRLVAWLACFAVLLASLAPTVSHAVNAWRLAATADTCELHAHASGEHAMPQDPAAGLEEGDGKTLSSFSLGGHEHGSHDVKLHFEHCPFCFTHAGSFALAPPALLTLPLALPELKLHPFLYLHASHVLFAWRAQQPRAPPSLS